MNSNTRQINQFISNQFAWTLFYMEFADKLLLYKNNRPQLLEMIKGVFDDLSLRYPFVEKDGTPLYDICPFTVFGCFNKGISNESRIAIMKEIGNKLNVTVEVPTAFDGIPVLMPMRAWFFVGKNKRKADDIPNLWNVFEAGINFADNPSEVSKTAFVNCYEKVRKQLGIKWNLTIGLYWIRPFSYLNLDELNRRYLAQEKSPYYNIIARISNLKQLTSAKTYLELISACKEFFAKHDSPHRSFPELSHAVWTQMTLGGQPPEAKDEDKTGKPGWIFQGNPKYYDVIDAVKNLDVISWDVKQYRNHIKKDDRAYIWVSGPGGGIVASGVILCDPEVREYSKPDSYDLSGNFTTGEHNEVDIKLTNKIIDSIIKREVFLADERLKKVSTINFANATNFKLTPEKADVIDSIINGTYSSQGPEIQGKDSAPSSRHWIYAPGRGSSKWDEFYSQGIMGIGWDEMGDLKQYPSKDAMKTKMKELYGAEYSYINSALATWQFANEIQTGDIVYAKKGMTKIIGRGIVESDYVFDSKRQEYRHIRKINWTHKGDWEHPGQAVIKVLTEITPYTEYVKKLEALFIDDDTADIPPEEREITYDPYTEDDFLNEVFMDSESYDTLVNLLRSKQNIILQGAPGVGKTFVAKRLAFSMMGEKDTSRVMMVQFHQSYSYEDFIMGFRPSKDGFELTPGPFYQFCKKAQDDNERDYFFIIDEINRGNVSKIFGELMMLIEKEKRGEKLRLLYSDELFSVPENVYIVGMMNTADRSLAIIDYALRRRFAFFELEPSFDSDGFKALMQRINNPKFNALVGQIKALNEFIGKDESLGRGFRIGHSYLCTDEEVTDEWLESVVKYELLPLLSEYWFDEPSKKEQWARKLSDALYD
jgi:5-methylcytosine-specific restriction protein B